MTNDPETNKAIAALIRAAKDLLSKAEELHGQPLFYDEDGNYIDQDVLLGQVADEADKNFLVPSGQQEDF